jgi:hypothetical protein
VATVGSDLFTEAANNPLSAHSVTTGAGWTLEAAQFTVIAATDTLQHNLNAIQRARKGDDIGADDMDVSASVAVAGATLRLAGVCARMSTDNFINQYEAYVQFKTATTQDVFLFKNVAGTRTQLGTAVVTLNQNVQATLKLAIRAGTQEVFVNGVSQIATTEADATLAGRQYAGVIMNGNNSSNALLDNFLSESVAAPAAALAGTATGTALTAPAPFTTAIPLAASAGAQATTAPTALTTGIPVAAAVLARVTTGPAIVITAIPLTAAVAVQATTAPAPFSTAIPFSASGAAMATSAGVLTTAIQCAASVSAIVTSTATLTAAGPATGLAGTAAGLAGVAAVLTTAIPVTASAAVHVAIAAGLTTGLPLLGTATGAASITATLTTSAGVAGAAIVHITGAGTLTTGLVLTAAVLGRALALGALTTLVPDQDYAEAVWGGLTQHQASAGTLTPRMSGTGSLAMRTPSFGTVAVRD